MSNFTDDQLAEINSIITGRILDFYDSLRSREQISPPKGEPVISGQMAGTPRLAIVTELHPKDSA